MKAENTDVPASHAITSSGLRTDIQALRGLAVLLVIAFHYFPTKVTGGYVGVDAFLAISGFLITSHLKRELEVHGTIRLAQFWARRLRRLLPAATFVLIATLVATRFFSPSMEWDRTVRAVTAAAIYVYNFVLAADATDYFQHDLRPSAVQHFWSLNLEEQFYIFWPLLLFFAWKAWGKKGQTRGLAFVTLGLMTASFATSALLSRTYPSASYFLLPARMWEFLAGAATALLGLQWPAGRTHIYLRGVGYAGLILSGLFLPQDLAFPGWIASIPIVATILVLVPAPCHPKEAKRPPVLRPLAMVGDLSYSLYLWHWPLLVLCRNRFGLNPEPIPLLITAILTTVAAWVTKRFVEDQFRFTGPASDKTSLRTYSLAMALTGCVGLSSYVLFLEYKSLLDSSDRTLATVLASNDPCLGAAARKGQGPCPEDKTKDVIVPHPVQAVSDASTSCSPRPSDDNPVTCSIGDKETPVTLALIGDSHAAHLMPGLDIAARQADVRIVTYIKTGCRFGAFKEGPLRQGKACRRWAKKVRSALAKDKSIDGVVMMELASWVKNVAERHSVDYPNLLNEAAAAYAEEIERLPSHIRRTIVIRDTPRSEPGVLSCLERLTPREAELERGACSVPRSRALFADPLVLAAERQPDDEADVLDLSHVFCGKERCLSVIGNVVVFRDTTHLTKTFSRTLAPLLVEPLSTLRRELG